MGPETGTAYSSAGHPPVERSALGREGPRGGEGRGGKGRGRGNEECRGGVTSPGIAFCWGSN